MDWWEDDYIELMEFESEFRIKIGEDYMTSDGSQAKLMYHLTISGRTLFFGHVCEILRGEYYPVALQWFDTGKVDPMLYDEGYTIIGPWAEPKRHVRYVYLYREEGELKTGVGNEVPENFISVKKVLL